MLSLALDCSLSRGLPPGSVVMQLRQHHVGMREGERCEQTPAAWPLVLPQPFSPESRDPLWSENSESLLGPVPQQSSPGSNYSTWGQSEPRPCSDHQPGHWSKCTESACVVGSVLPQVGAVSPVCPTGLSSPHCCPELLVPLLP